MRDSKPPPDGTFHSARPIPADVASAFDAAGGLDATALRIFFSALEGAPLSRHLTTKGVLVNVYGFAPSELKRLAPIYNAALQADPPCVPADSGTPAAWFARPLKPGALDRAIDSIATTIPERIIAKRLARDNRGRRPPLLADAGALRDRLRLTESEYVRACEIYEHAVFLYRRSRSMRAYRHGHRRRQQAFRMSLVLPAALARRLPLVFATTSPAPILGDDLYGALRCSAPLRSGTVGLIAYLVGLASRPERFSRYGQVDEEGRVLSSQTRIYQSLAAVASDAEPGGAGHRCVADWIGELAALEITAALADQRGLRARGHVKTDMSIPSTPVTNVEKLVDDGDELSWVTWDDPRSPTRRAEHTLRFTIASWVLERTAAGDRVYFDPGVWRCLSPAARALYLETQGRIARTSDKTRHKFVEWFAADPWALRFGMHDLSDHRREEIILAGLHELYLSDDRVVGYAQPWFGTNASAKSYRVYVDGRSYPTAAARQRIRRSDFLVQLELHRDGAQWPGRLGSKAAANAPPDTS